MKKISEMTPGEALTEQALAVFKRRLEQARKKAVESAAATKAVFDALEDMCIDPDGIPSAAEFLAVLIVTAVVFTKGLSAALAWRGYKAVGGEFMLLLLPIIYYEAKRIILDFVADFVELYRRAED